MLSLLLDDKQKLSPIGKESYHQIRNSWSKAYLYTKKQLVFW